MVWLELAVREAAVYVIVLMLPLAFAALVWPARRVWATRSVELLVALILSKFAIVAVLGLAGAALGQGPHGGLATAVAGTVLVLLGAFAPWALLRLIPLSELAAGAAATLRPELDGALRHGVREDKPASDAPPLRPDESRATSEDLARDAARSEVGGLEEQASVVGGPLRGEALGARQARADRTPEETAGSEHMPDGTDGRAAVLEPVGVASASGEGAAQHVSEEPPEITLGPSSFDDEGKWNGPVFDVLAGQPGEDHDPLPPGEDQELL
jgi:hypothetical protein